MSFYSCFSFFKVNCCYNAIDTVDSLIFVVFNCLGFRKTCIFMDICFRGFAKVCRQAYKICVIRCTYNVVVHQYRRTQLKSVSNEK